MNIKEALENIYRHIPQGFAYREVKFYVYHAIQKLKAVESKEVKRETQHQQQLEKQEAARKAQTNVYDVKQTLNLIDEMIRQEKEIINKINEKKNQVGGEEEGNLNLND